MSRIEAAIETFRIRARNIAIWRSLAPARHLPERRNVSSFSHAALALASV
jgi:hypothetical protein